jgi:hypothetical protein
LHKTEIYEFINGTKSNHRGKQPVNYKPHPHRALEVEPEPTGLSRKEIQAMIAQQMQIAGGGYAIPDSVRAMNRPRTRTRSTIKITTGGYSQLTAG